MKLDPKEHPLFWDEFGRLWGFTAVNGIFVEIGPAEEEVKPALNGWKVRVLEERVCATALPPDPAR